VGARAVAKSWLGLFAQLARSRRKGDHVSHASEPTCLELLSELRDHVEATCCGRRRCERTPADALGNKQGSFCGDLTAV
jgi:hypothetical protein